jgi:hypothetical protein
MDCRSNSSVRGLPGRSKSCRCADFQREKSLGGGRTKAFSGIGHVLIQQTLTLRTCNKFIFSEFNFLARFPETLINEPITFSIVMFPPTHPPMKIKTPLVAALSIAAMSIGNAFTLDAVGYGGGVLTQNPYSVFIPGYGELVFEAAPGSSLVVNSAYQNDNGFGGPSLSFDENESIKVTFNGAEPLNVDFDFVGQSAGESFVIEKDLFTPQAFLVSLKGGGDGAGLYAVSWNAVPEPASAALGLLGGMMLLLRRRR